VSSKKGEKENVAPNTIDEDDVDAECTGLPELQLDQFLETISQLGIHTFAACINVAGLEREGSGRQRADALARVVWERRSYRFV
jgi:hypothetical protein